MLSPLKRERLKKIYDQIPEVNCQGYCHTTCGVIPFMDAEFKYIIDRMGFNPFANWRELAAKGCMDCPALIDKRCSVYEARPLIYRLYGASEDFKCHYGCKPKKYLTAQQTKKLLNKIKRIV